ncbi:MULTISPECIES: SPW repeat protein [Rhodococcus]|uniref:SPW repeat protein n=1 Tax=Rhodococcus TaxID=1827 RepID=UPI001ED8F4B9|nr:MULTISPECIES: SPW repeat protein [Rhodococcus]
MGRSHRAPVCGGGRCASTAGSPYGVGGFGPRVLSAWIIGFADQTSLTMSNLIAGLAVALLAAAFGSAYGRTHGMTFVAPVLGIWLVVSPWLVTGVTTGTAMIWSNVVVGAVVCVLGLAAIAVGTDLLRRSS